MTSVLAVTVVVTDPETHESVVLLAGQAVPGRYSHLVTNPSVFTVPVPSPLPGTGAVEEERRIIGAAESDAMDTGGDPEDSDSGDEHESALPAEDEDFDGPAQAVKTPGPNATLSELRAHAIALGITVPDGARKAEIRGLLADIA